MHDQGGLPLEDLELWLVPGRGGGFLEWAWATDHAMSTRSDENGRFAFADVAAGDWRLGPAPPRRHRQWRP